MPDGSIILIQGFIDFIVLPLYESLKSYLPGEIDEHVENILSTKSYWKSISDNHLPIEKVEIPTFSTHSLKKKSNSSGNSSDDGKSPPLDKNRDSIMSKYTKKEHLEKRNSVAKRVQDSSPFTFFKRLATQKKSSNESPRHGSVSEPSENL